MTRLLFFLLFFLGLSISATGQDQTVGLFSIKSAASEGYTLYSPMNHTTTWLIDNCGKVVNSWESDFQPGLSTYLLENGDLMRTAKLFPNDFGIVGGIGGRIERFNWDGNLIWEYELNDNTFSQHHDIEVLPNGNMLLLVWEKRSADEFVEAGRNPDFLPASILWSEVILEIKPQGSNQATVVWEWREWDHLIQEYDSTKANFGKVADHPELLDINYFGGDSPKIDWTHFNSIDYNETLDQILLSSRHLHEIYIIDHSTTSAEAATHSGGNSGKGGDFLFRWGNPEAYQAGTPDNQVFFGQHDAHWIPENMPDSGKIMVFNNGQARDFSSVDIINPSIDSAGAYQINATTDAYLPDNLFWTYTSNPPEDFFSHFISGAQQLPNGNTLICAGSKGRFFEIVTGTNGIVWEYINPVTQLGPIEQGTIINSGGAGALSNPVFRAKRYSVDYNAFSGRDLTPQGPVELNPLPDAGICKETANTHLDKSNILIFPNPTSGYVFIEFNDFGTYHIQVKDVLGQVVLKQRTKSRKEKVELSSLNSGIYYLQIDDRILKKIVLTK